MDTSTTRAPAYAGSTTGSPAIYSPVPGSRHLRSLLAALALLASPLTALADASLAGSVSFANGLYTYSYVLDDPDLEVYEVFVVVNSHQAYGETGFPPAAHNAPTGWNFGVYYGGYMGDDPPQHHNAPIVLWGWGVNQARLPGNNVVFSVSTDRAPSTALMDVTYELYAPSYTGGPPNGTNFYVGQVVAPDFRSIPLTPPVPETSSGGLMLLGLAGWLAHRALRARASARIGQGRL